MVTPGEELPIHDAPRSGAMHQRLAAFGHQRACDITRFDIERFKKDRRKSVSGPSVNRELALLSALLQVAVESGELAVNPVRGIRRFKENEKWRYVDADEAQRLIDACPTPLRRVVVCALYTGMRAGEIKQLQWEDVHFREGVIWIPDSKSGEPREVPIHVELRKELKALNRKHSSGSVFVKANGAPYKDWRGAWAAATKVAGLSGLRFHDLRHTFGTWQVSSGTHSFVIQDLMGHKTMVMTRRYSHVTTADKRAAIENLPSASRSGVTRLRDKRSS